ncbi:hypothetical protein Slala01_28860 [Streptomyces lavendulae subsp. lavendulae]|nr:hypothetical protein Slala01_28860 [Streptomyces lavendulae subsp. lavendulae]
MSRRATAASRSLISSARCSRADSPLSEGQSTFCTVAIHIPRNSAAPARPPVAARAGRTPGGPAGSRTSAAAPGSAAPAAAGPAAVVASTPAAPASSPRRPMCAM